MSKAPSMFCTHDSSVLLIVLQASPDWCNDCRRSRVFMLEEIPPSRIRDVLHASLYLRFMEFVAMRCKVRHALSDCVSLTGSKHMEVMIRT